MALARGRVRRSMASGVVVLVPLVITVWVLRVLFGFTAGILLPIIDPAVEHWPWILRAGLSLAILLAVVYLLGELTFHIMGQRLLALGDAVLLRVPLVKVIYKASKQVVTAFKGPDSAAFKSVVLVEFPGQGMRSVGFLTSTFTTADGTVWHTVFIPTTPNPTTGFLQILPAPSVTFTNFTVEEAFKMIMSLGVLIPTELEEMVQGADAPRLSGSPESGR